MTETVISDAQNPGKASTKFPATKHILSQIDNVPALSDVSPDQALSYFNQMLENLMLLHRTIILDCPTEGSLKRRLNERAMSSSSVCSVCSSGSLTSNSQRKLSLSSISSAGSVSPPSSPGSHADSPGMVPPAAKSQQSSVRRGSTSDVPLLTDSLNTLKVGDTESILEEAAAVAAAVFGSSEPECVCEPRRRRVTRINYKPEDVESQDSHIEYTTPATVTSSNSNRKVMTKTELASKSVIIKRFWSRKPPGIAVWPYLLRIHHYCPMSTSVYLAASLYIYQLCIYVQTIILTPLSVHRLILATLRTACKSIEDINFKQQRFASVTGVTDLDLYRLEVAFLFLIDFDIFIDSTRLQHHLVVLTELNIQADKYRSSPEGPVTSDIAVI